MRMNVYRNVSVIAHFNIDERTLFVQRFLGENYIHAETTVREPLDITIGDYARYNGIRYYVNTLPDVTKNATNQYVYTLTFESEYYDFAKVQYRSDGQGDFYLMGDLELFLDLLVENMNRVYGAGVWTKGTCTQTNEEYKLLKFEAENCRQAIQRLCTEFSGEFSFAQKVISFSDEQTTDTGLTFLYKTGLRNIQRRPIESGNIITRLYAYGSSRNLGSSYGKLRLELNTGGVDYIESNTATYGTIEGAVIFDDVFPRRTGTVSSAASNVLFIDGPPPGGIDFNVNTYLIPDVTAKVNFLTGDCAGYTFDIASFNNTTHEFEIIPVTLEDGSVMPNDDLNPAATDTYVLIDITMPAEYIAAAEAELLALAETYIAKYDHPRVAYQLTPDWRYLKARSVNLTIGDTITIEDTDLGVDVKVRITELSQQVIQPYKYTLSLTDQVEYAVSGQAQIILGTYKTAGDSAGKIAASPVVRDIGRSRRNWRDTEELRSMVFDPDDGYFDPVNVKPLSIETTMLAAGSKSGNFQLSGVQVKPNYLGNNNKLSITGGTLVHMAIDTSGEDEIGTWTLVANPDYEAGGLTTETAYYLYAKCHKTNYTDGDNQVIVTSTAYQADQTTHWYFLVGILHSTTGSVPRGLSLTYGQTLINGGFVTTGKVQSANGNTYLDLDNNTLVIASGAGTIAGTNITSLEDGATAGATWGEDVASIPARLTEDDTPEATGVYITPNYIGFYDLGAEGWPVRIKNNAGSGEFFVGEATKYVSYTAAEGLIVRGKLTASDIQAGGTITGNTLQTDTGAAEGHYKRMTVSGANNNITIHDADNLLAMTIDDNIFGAETSPGILCDSASGGGLRFRVDAENVCTLRENYFEMVSDSISYIMKLTRKGQASEGDAIINLYMDNGLIGDALWFKYNNIEKFAVDYQGNVRVAGTVDLVDIAAHTHTGENSGGQVPYTSLGSIPSTFASTNHNLVDTTHHPVAGLTTGHFLKATGTATYGFAAHGLSAADVGAEASGAVATHAALLTGVHGLAITAGKTLTVQDNVTITGALGTAAYAATGDFEAAIGVGRLALNKIAGKGAGVDYIMKWSIDTGAYWSAT